MYVWTSGKLFWNHRWNEGYSSKFPNYQFSLVCDVLVCDVSYVFPTAHSITLPSPVIARRSEDVDWEHQEGSTSIRPFRTAPLPLAKEEFSFGHFSIIVFAVLIRYPTVLLPPSTECATARGIIVEGFSRILKNFQQIRKKYYEKLTNPVPLSAARRECCNRHQRPEERNRPSVPIQWVYGNPARWKLLRKNKWFLFWKVIIIEAC